MVDIKQQRLAALCLIPPHLCLALASHQKPHIFLLLYCPAVFLLSGAPSSQVLSLSLTFSSHLSVSDLVYLATLSFWFFPFFSLIPWMLLLFQGLAYPSTPSVVWDPALQKLSPGCWNLYPVHPNLQQAWFSIISNCCSSSEVVFNFESNAASGITLPL